MGERPHRAQRRPLELLHPGRVGGQLARLVALDSALEDKALTADEEAHLTAFATKFDLTQAELDRLLGRAAKDTDVLAVFLFGSAARGDSGAGSDVDVCLVLTAEPRSRMRLAEKRMVYLGDVDLDVQVFQSLPLYIRTRVRA